jgi:hypothetical protein
MDWLNCATDILAKLTGDLSKMTQAWDWFEENNSGFFADILTPNNRSLVYFDSCKQEFAKLKSMERSLLARLSACERLRSQV